MDEEVRICIDELKLLAEKKGLKRSWVYHAFISANGVATQYELMYIAKVIGYDEEWAYNKWKEQEADKFI